MLREPCRPGLGPGSTFVGVFATGLGQAKVVPSNCVPGETEMDPREYRRTRLKGPAASCREVALPASTVPIISIGEMIRSGEAKIDGCAGPGER